MSRRAARFRQADIARAVKAVTGLGFKIAAVKIGPDGGINIIPIGADVSAGDDAELAEFRAKHGYQ